EVPQSRQDRVWSRLAQAAQRTVLYRLGQLFEQIQIAQFSLPFDDALKDLQHAVRPFTAQDTLAARFILREAHEKPGDLDHTRVLIHHYKAAGSDHGARLAQ